MSPRDESPLLIPVSELFGPALDVATTWVGLSRRNVIVAANRSFQQAIAAAGGNNDKLDVLLPCWARHVGASTSISCPCPQLANKPAQPGAFCQASPPRSPAHIGSHLLDPADPTRNLRLIVIEPPRESSALEPAQQVTRVISKVRAALDEVEHHLIADLARGADIVRPAGLSSREWEVAQALAAGRRSPAIATALGISVHTVRNHIKSVYRKLNVRTQAALRRRLLRSAR